VDIEDLGALYTDDAVILNVNTRTWVRGRPAIREFLGKGGGYRLSPAAYHSQGSTAYVTGTFVVGTGDATKHLSNFHITARKDRDSTWRIAAESFTVEGPAPLEAFTAEKLIAQMDAAKTKRAVVLSVAYWFGDPSRSVSDEYAKVKAENDWISKEVSRHPERLVGFCSFNPVKEYALGELERCAKELRLSGLKLHIGNSGTDLRNPEHLERLRRVFAEANQRRLPIVIHLRTVPTYGREEASIFLNEVLPAAPDITVQIAHLAGHGGYDTATDNALAVFAEALAAGDPRVKNLMFDVTAVPAQNTGRKASETIANRIRQLGLSRVVFGSDMPPNPPAAALWATFRQLPLTDDELNIIAANVAPYLR
jgi:predicted TIM-barrel fold metal-dependent hydrolase